MVRLFAAARFSVTRRDRLIWRILCRETLSSDRLRLHDEPEDESEAADEDDAGGAEDVGSATACWFVNDVGVEEVGVADTGVGETLGLSETSGVSDVSGELGWSGESGVSGVSGVSGESPTVAKRSIWAPSEKP